MPDGEQDWTEEELDEWWEENFDLADEHVEPLLRNHGVLPDPLLQTFDRIAPVPWKSLALDTKRRFRAKIEHQRGEGQSEPTEPEPAVIESIVPELTPIVTGIPGESEPAATKPAGAEGPTRETSMFLGMKPATVMMAALVVPVIILLWYLGNAMLGGGDTDSDDSPAATSASPTTGAEENTQSDDTDQAADTGSPDGLSMANRIPEPAEATVDGTVVEVRDGDQSTIEAASAGLSVRLVATRTGGQIKINGERGVGPSGELQPDGQGGFTWDDATINAKNPNTDETVPDSDEVSDVSIDDDVLTFTVRRTNHDASTWEAVLSIQLPTGATQWWHGLPAAGETDCTGSVEGTLDGETLTVAGSTSLDPGTVVEVWVGSETGTIRQLVEVGDGGSISATVDGVKPYVSDGSSYVNVAVINGSHLCVVGSVDGE